MKPTEVAMSGSHDLCRGPELRMAVIACGNVHIRIDDSFACYLATRNNPELAEYVRKVADDLRRFISAIESRVTAPAGARRSDES